MATCPSGFNEVGTDFISRCGTSPCPVDSKGRNRWTETVLICATPSYTTQIRINTGEGYTDPSTCC